MAEKDPPPPPPPPIPPGGDPTGRNKMDYGSVWKHHLLDKTTDDRAHCGLAIIVANQKADKSHNFFTLPASVNEAAKRVKGVLQDLNFVTLHRERFEVTDPEELKAMVLQTAGMKYPDNYKAIIFYFIGHGRLGKDGKHRLCTEKGDVKVDTEILLPFQPDQSPDLANTPKLLFFDCCHGEQQDKGKVVPMGDPVERSVAKLMEYTIRPSIGNALVAYAAASPYQAKCHKDEGPLWTSSLLKQLPLDQSIYDVLHRTNTALMNQYDKWMKDPEKKAKIWGPDPNPILLQQPVFLSTLHGDPVLNLAGLSRQQPVHPPLPSRVPLPPSKGHPYPLQAAHQGQLVQHEKRTARGRTAQSFAHFPEPKLLELLNFVGTGLKACWQTVGLQLEIQDGDIQGIASGPSNLSSDAQLNCLRDVFSKWRKAQTSDYSWKHLVEVLLMEAINQPDLVDSLYDQLRRKYNMYQ